MKRTTTNLKLKRRLELVRTTVRELNPAQLAKVNGGDGEGDAYGPTNCDCRYSLWV